MVESKALEKKDPIVKEFNLPRVKSQVNVELPVNNNSNSRAYMNGSQSQTDLGDRSRYYPKERYGKNVDTEVRYRSTNVS